MLMASVKTRQHPYLCVPTHIFLYIYTTSKISKWVDLYGQIKRLNQTRRKGRKEEKPVGRRVEQARVSGFSGDIES